jgi:hypothetical protein
MYEKKLEWLRPRALRPGMVIYWGDRPIGTVINNPYRTSSNGHWWDQVNLRGGYPLEYDSEDWVLVEIPPEPGEVFWANYTDILDQRDRGELSEEEARAEIERLKKEY